MRFAPLGENKKSFGMTRFANCVNRYHQEPL
jgi:hypothetical protein